MDRSVTSFSDLRSIEIVVSHVLFSPPRSWCGIPLLKSRESASPRARMRSSARNAEAATRTRVNYNAHKFSATGDFAPRHAVYAQRAWKIHGWRVLPLATGAPVARNPDNAWFRTPAIFQIAARCPTTRCYTCVRFARRKQRVRPRDYAECHDEFLTQDEVGRMAGVSPSN